LDEALVLKGRYPRSQNTDEQHGFRLRSIQSFCQLPGKVAAISENARFLTDRTYEDAMPVMHRLSTISIP
jgi:hypothetical protein